MWLFRPGGVNLRSCLCGEPMYASAQFLDFLARTKNPHSHGYGNCKKQQIL
jgi:hypothetical protein